MSEAGIPRKCSRFAGFQNATKMDQLKGIHHVTAITSSAEKIYAFFTEVLAMRLVKKTVNQDDIRTYHLFFADDQGNAGTDMTFFDFPGIPAGVHGTNEISRVSFRVPDDRALEYWVRRFDRFQVAHGEIGRQFGRKYLFFADFDDQHYMLVSDQDDHGVAPGIPWQGGPVPAEYAITGLGPVFVRIADFHPFSEVLEKALLFRRTGQEGTWHLFETGEGGNGAMLIVEDNPVMTPGRQGYGTIHHAAFRLADRAALDQWIDRVAALRLPNSGYVNRYFFESLYIRVAPQILFELATDGPGFMGDEPYETLGEKLSLPPFLEPRRPQIEQLVRPIDTVRSTRTFRKEYE